MSCLPILREYKTFADAKVKFEESTDHKELYMSGIFIQAEQRNHNQRIYPLHEIKNAVNFINAEVAKGNTVMGECNHPQELTINLDRVSHFITEMWMQGNDGYGKLKIVETPMGQIIKTLIRSGAKLGVSSRGSGNVDDNGYVSDFEIVTVDIVAQPSAPNAYPRAIYESLFNMKGGSRLYETAEAVEYDKSAQSHLDKEILKLINELKH